MIQSHATFEGIHAIAEVATGLSYLAIPVALLVFYFKCREYIPRLWSYGLAAFCIFITACGVAHLSGIFAGIAFMLSAHLFMAAVSVPSAILVGIITPKAMKVMKEKWEREQRLEKVEEAQMVRYRALVTAVGQSAWRVAPDGRVIDTHGWQDIVGHDCSHGNLPDDAFFTLFIHPDDLERAKAEFFAAVAAGDTYVSQFRVVRHDGGVRHWRRRGTLITYPDGHAEVVGIGVDVTEEVEREERLRETLTSAQEASRAKSDFMTVMSHELRTPLTAVLGYAELLHDHIMGPMTEEQTSFAGRIMKSAEHQMGMIDDIMDFAAIEAGKLTITPAVVNAAKVAREATLLVEPLCNAKNLKFQMTCPPVILMTTDGGRLKQVLLNLLTNAVKFTEEGHICLNIFEKGDQICFQVIDTGIGISEANQDKIFEKFWQVSKGRTRTAPGVGLGLSIVKRIVDGLGGTVALKSFDTPFGREPRGSTFTVILPRNMESVVVEHPNLGLKRLSA